MQVIIMCGGYYDFFKEHKALTIINGERLIERTTRLLKERNIDYYITGSDDFKKYGKVLKHNNSYRVENGVIKGYWVDAYYPTEKPTIYLHGDVYYSESAIDKILNLNPKVNTLIGNEIARNPEHKNWGEPFGYIVVNQKKFRKSIDKCKELQNKGQLERGYAISWELYRVDNELDPNYMLIKDESYLSINDETIDIDNPSQIEELNNKIANL